MFKKTVLGLSAAVVAFGLAGPAKATLIGDSVDCAIQDSFGSIWSCSSPTAVVGAGNELQLTIFGFPVFNIDIGASSFSMTSLSPLAAGGGEVVTVSSLNWTNFPSATITGITNFFTDALSGIEEADVTTGPNSVMIDFDTSEWNPGQVLSFDFVTTHDLPEPASIALFGVGLAGLALAARRRRLGHTVSGRRRCSVERIFQR